MGADYALVHLLYTIPPAVGLTICYSPLSTPLGTYKISFLIVIAVVSTIPWDSYLIRHKIWSYPPDVILGPTLFDIPAEEVFFFVVQTYITSLLYLLVSKPTFHPIYLRGRRLLHDSKRIRLWRWPATGIIVGALAVGTKLVLDGGRGLYMGLIVTWAGSFILLLWTVAHQFILGLPLSNTLLPIIVPTLYLWTVDTLALRRGTWVIESGTKLEWQLWDGLDIEEAIFFLVTNTLVVFGMIAFDNALAIIITFPALFPDIPSLPSPVLLIKALLVPIDRYDESRISGLEQASSRLHAKSRSFYLASGVFPGRLRVDLVLLYSFCRVADDLIDDAKSVEAAEHWTEMLKQYITLAYDPEKSKRLETFITTTFPVSAWAALRLLPTAYLTSEPLHDLIKGFETDLEFSKSQKSFPIRDEACLHRYGVQVAGTVAESCLELVYHHTTTSTSELDRRRIVQAGVRMGVALQYINISRDISVDATLGRVYLPTTWLHEVQLHPEDVIQNPSSKEVSYLRRRLLTQAMQLYDGAIKAIQELPKDVRGPMRVAVESYVEIGRVLQQPGYRVRKGKATVPALRRLRVAWKAMQSG